MLIGCRQIFSITDLDLEIVDGGGAAEDVGSDAGADADTGGDATGATD
jgi:hypothetical protein